MGSTSLIIAAMMPIFIVIASGFFARKVGWLSEHADRSLMTLVVNVLYPAMIFSFVLGNEALKQPSNVILPPLFGATIITAGFGVCMMVARKLNLGSERDCRTFAFATGLNNYGYFPIPIIALLFDRETTGVLLVHNLGVELAMWSLGVGYILSKDDSKSAWRRVFSPPVLSILIAIPLNLVGADEFLPQLVYSTLDLLGNCAIPLGLILIGATFADLSKRIRFRERIQIPMTACVLRLGIFPLALLLLALLLPMSIELKRVIIIQAAMPCAVFPIVLARHFGGSPEIALKVVLATTILSLVTIPIWISLGLSWIPVN